MGVPPVIHLWMFHYKAVKHPAGYPHENPKARLTSSFISFTTSDARWQLNTPTALGIFIPPIRVVIGDDLEFLTLGLPHEMILRAWNLKYVRISLISQNENVHFPCSSGAIGRPPHFPSDLTRSIFLRESAPFHGRHSARPRYRILRRTMSCRSSTPHGTLRG